MKFAGFEPGILGIIIYLIFSAFMARKKKQEKLQKRGAQNSPPTKKSVFDLLDTLKSEFEKEFDNSINPQPAVIIPTEEKKPDLSEMVEELPDEEMTEISDKEFKKTKQSNYFGASDQDNEYSDINYEEVEPRESESYSPFKQNPSLKHVMNLSPMKQAIVLKEIFDKPVGLRREIELF